MVRLTVEDGGPGVPDEALSRLFDKFFRVRDAARGRVAGRASAWRRARPRRGDGRHASPRGTERARRPGRRRRPACGGGAPAVGGGSRWSAVTPAHGPGAVLLVEDDAATRRERRRVLEAHGYRVDEAADGADALRALGAPAARTSSCSTSACRTWTEWRSSGAFGARRPRRSSSSRPATARRQGRGARAGRRRLRDQAVRAWPSCGPACGAVLRRSAGPAAEPTGDGPARRPAAGRRASRGPGRRRPSS